MVGKILNVHDHFPKRKTYADVDLREKYVTKVINNRKPLYFIATSVSESLPFQEYELHMHGSLLSGDKATVIIKKIPVFFDIRVPDGTMPKLFDQQIKQELQRQKIYTLKIESHRGLGPKGFNRWGDYKRVYFKKLLDRKKAIQYYDSSKYIHDKQEKRYETAYDDLSAYYRKACRESTFSLTDWNLIEKYTVEQVSITSKADYVIRCDYNNIKWSDIDKTKDENELYAKDKSLCMCWDIETHSYRNDGSVPKPEDTELDEIFMIGCTFHWRSESTAFLKVGICTKKMASRDGYLIIQCNNEREAIIAFYKLINSMMPDYLIEFNGGQYDWPWIIHRTIRYNLLPVMAKNLNIMNQESPDINAVKQWNIKKSQVKVEADKKVDCVNVRFPGYECVDVRIKFRQLYKTAEESSLKFFLKECGLESKLDMPYDRLQSIFRRCDMDEIETEKFVQRKYCKESDPPDRIQRRIARFKELREEEMAQAMDYCIVDAMRCQELMLAKNMISDMREVGIRSFTSMYDCIYLADGMKVRNLILHKAIARQIEFSSIAHPAPKFKYPGAYVVDPETGLENRRPVTGLDFSSLYPSLIRTYNLSPEYAVFTKEEAKKLKKQGHTLHYIEFQGPGGTKIKGWTVRHDNKDEKRGIYPTILGELFDTRSEMKKSMEPFKKQREVLDKQRGVLTTKNAQGSLSDDEDLELKRIQKELASVQLKYNYIDAKQKALKIFMNTFYGLMGDVTSSLFLLLLAGAVTIAGQYNLKLVADYVKSKGYKIKYGDTDSLYIVPPDSVFKEIDRKFKQGKITKLEYWTAMVEITMAELNRFRDEVNKMLLEDNGTVFLVMAYEEVLFPFISLTKKMYYGIAHERLVNFYPKKLFIRGMAPIKRGFPEFIKKLDMEIMWESVSIENTKTLRQLVEDKLAEIPKRAWSLEDFIQTAEWRPTKDQKTIKMFVDKLSPEDRPKPGKRFQYVVVNTNPYYSTIEGHKKTLKKGQMMEYYETAKEKQYEPNLVFYMQGISGSGGMVVGQFARFISYHSDFDAPTDKSRMNKAKAYMKKICAQYNVTFHSQDKVCKEIYKYTNEAIQKACADIYGDSSQVLNKIKNDPQKDIISAINREVANTTRTKAYKDKVYQTVTRLCREYDPFELWDMYAVSPDNIRRQRARYVLDGIRRETKRLNTVIPKLEQLSKVKNEATAKIVMSIRKDMGLGGLDVSNSKNIDEELTLDTYGRDNFARTLERKTKKLKIPAEYVDSLEELSDIYQNIRQLKMLEKWDEHLIGFIQFAKSAKSGGKGEPPYKIELAQKDEIRGLVADLKLPTF